MFNNWRSFALVLSATALIWLFVPKNTSDSTNPSEIEREGAKMASQTATSTETDLKPTSTEDLIDYYAEINGADPNLAYWVAWCESRLENVPNHNGGIYGKGIYQFIQSTWDNRCEGDIWNPEDNINCGTKLLGLGELSHWQPYSGHCWLPKL